MAALSQSQSKQLNHLGLRGISTVNTDFAKGFSISRPWMALNNQTHYSNSITGSIDFKTPIIFTLRTTFVTGQVKILPRDLIPLRVYVPINNGLPFVK